MLPSSNGPRRPIGSDFQALEASLMAGSTAPWVGQYGTTVYLETGRQALRAVAQDLVQRGIRQILVPGFHCESMVQPLAARGLEILVSPVTEDLTFDFGEGWDRISEIPHESAILFASYFGYAPTHKHVEAATVAQEAGIAVIEDETHRVLAPGGSPADYVLGSMRKTLPLADGAYLSTTRDMEKIFAAAGESDSLRWQVMRSGTANGLSAHDRDLMIKENERLDDPSRLNWATEESVSIVSRFPYGWFRHKRIENDRLLREHLRDISGVELLLSSAAMVPSHLVIKVADPRSVQSRLAERGIFCPIHWQRSEWGSRNTWPENILSLPVDHRYGPEDMERISDQLARAVN